MPLRLTATVYGVIVGDINCGQLLHEGYFQPWKGNTPFPTKSAFLVCDQADPLATRYKEFTLSLGDTNSRGPISRVKITFWQKPRNTYQIGYARNL